MAQAAFSAALGMSGDSRLLYSGHDMAVDHEGNLHVLSNTFGPNTAGDFLTVKYDRRGRELWSRRFDGPIHGHDTRSAIAVDTAGNVYVTGYVQLREKADTDDINAFGYATIKYDKDGKQAWAAYYREAANVLHGPQAIAVDGNGNAYIVGTSELGVSESELISGFAKPQQFVTIKYDSGGQKDWVARHPEGGKSMSHPSDVTADRRGNVYVTSNCTTIKYDRGGRQVWLAERIHEMGTYGSNRAVQVDKAGGVHVLGYTRSLKKRYHDFVAIKYNEDGGEEWIASHVVPRKKQGYPVALALDGVGNIYVTGYVVTPARRPHGFHDWPKPEMVEFVTLKYGPDGKKKWMTKYAGAKHRRGAVGGLGIDRAGNIYVKGFIGHPHIRQQVGILIKYDNKGKEQWVTHFEQASEAARVLSASYSPGPEDVGGKWFENRRAAKKAALLRRIEGSSELNAKDGEGYTALERAAFEGHVEIVQTLIGKGAEVTDGAVWAAVMGGQAEAVKILVKARGGIAPDSPCVFAALTWVEEPAVVKAMLEAGLDASATDKNGDSLLDWPVSYGHTEIVKLLLDAGADVNARDCFGERLAHSALDGNDVGIVKAFLDAGLPVDTKNTYGESLLEQAVEENSETAVKVLLEAGADVKKEKEGGVPLLFEAIAKDNIGIVRLLVQAGVDCSARNEWGQTVLHAAVADSSRHVLVFLLQRGLDPNAKDAEGRTALQDAIDRHSKEIAAILRKYGAKE
jgi:ankyrin repeat protein